MKKIHANLLLVLVTVIWGGGFIFVEALLDFGVPAGMVTMIRGIIFSICAFALYFKYIFKITKKDVKVGLIAGITNAFAFLLQAIGQSYTTASHSALITVTYVIFVPLFCRLFYGSSLKLNTLIAVLICVLGTFLLVGGFGKVETDTLLGDGIVLLGAMMFGVNIAYLGHGGKETHYGVVSFFMAITLVVVSFIYNLFAGTLYLPTTGNTWKIIGCFAYLGILSSTLCQILQVVCQRYTSPVSASVIMTLEGFFGGIFSVIFGEPITWNLVVGGLLIVFALMLQEIDLDHVKKLMKKRE